MKLRSIYQFTDYRVFLLHFYAYKKNENPDYSYRVFSKHADLNSPNYLSLVMSGRRNLTVTNIHQFAKALGLFKKEIEYFEALVLFNQAQTPQESDYYDLRLEQLRRDTPQAQVKVTRKQVISEWYFPAVFLAVTFLKKDQDPIKTIAQKLHLTQEVVTHALEEFMQARLVIKDETGKLVINEDHVVYGDYRPNIQQKKFLFKQIEQSLESFQNHYDREGLYLSHALTVPKGFKAFDRLNKFIEHLTTEADQGKPDRIFQLNIQYFPLD